MGAWTKAISAFQVHPLPKTPCEPRTKKTLTFYHTGCLIGVPKILKMLLLESPHNWVGVHPLYTLNNHLGLFFIAHVTMHTSPPKKKKRKQAPPDHIGDDGCGRNSSTLIIGSNATHQNDHEHHTGGWQVMETPGGRLTAGTIHV